MNDPKFNYFKQKVLKHLNTLIQKEEKDGKTKETKKSFGDYLQDIYKAMGRGHLVPKRVSVTNPKTGKTFQTTVYINPNKKNGKKIYHADSKGARISLGKLKKQCEKCTNSNELMQLILDNRERFSDENGRPLPIVQELSNYVSQLNDKMESAVKPKNVKKPTKKTTKKPASNPKLTKDKTKTDNSLGKTYAGKDIVNTTTTDKNQKIALAKAEEIKDGGKEIIFKATPQLTKFVEQLTKYSSKELNRYFMTGVGVRDGFLWATDGRRLMRLRVEGLDDIGGNFRRIGIGMYDGVPDCYKCEIKDGQIILTQFDGAFPNGEKVIPKYTGENKAEINNKVLLEKLKSMEKDGAVDKKKDGYKTVALEVKGGKCFIDGTEIGTCFGLNDGHICFNYQYLQDALKNADTSTICFDSEKPDSRAVAISTNISDHVIMPMSPDKFPNYAQRRQEKAEENKEKERNAKAKAESNINYFNSVKENYKDKMPELMRGLIPRIKKIPDEALLNAMKTKDVDIEELAKNKNIDFHSREFLEKFGSYDFNSFVTDYLAMKHKDFADMVEAEIKRRGLTVKKSFDDEIYFIPAESLFCENESLQKTVADILRAI